MLHLFKIVSCVVLMHGLYTVDAQAIGACVDGLTETLTNGTETCLAMTDYVKCILLETKIYKTPNKTDWSQFKTQLEASLAEKDIHCQIDVMAIAEQLLEDDRNGVVHTTVRPKGYKNAKTVGECINTFTAKSASEFTCDRMTPYLKCVIRVNKLHTLTYNQGKSRQALEQSVKDTLDKLKIECDINFSSLIDEVRKEEGVVNGSTSHHGNGENGADEIVGSLSFVPLLLLTFVSVLVHH